MNGSRLPAHSSDGTRPNFDRFSVIDFGHTLKFGDYEASADGVLYELDPKYRRRLNVKRSEQEKGFGPALRRLRKQRGLKRSDFAPLNEKTVARLEQSKVDKPHAKTRALLARKLDVSPETIESL